MDGSISGGRSLLKGSTLETNFALAVPCVFENIVIGDGAVVLKFDNLCW